MKLTNFVYRELQLRLEKVVATQRYIEDFKKQQAEWRHLEREKVEAENRRIIEFAHYQQRKEEDRMAKVREREQAKENLHKMVHDSTPSAPLCHQDSSVNVFFLSFWFSSLSRSRWRKESVRRWSVSVRNFTWKSRPRLQDDRKL